MKKLKEVTGERPTPSMCQLTPVGAISLSPHLNLITNVKSEALGPVYDDLSKDTRGLNGTNETFAGKFYVNTELFLLSQAALYH